MMPKRQLFDRFPCDREPLEASSHEIRESGRQSLVRMSSTQEEEDPDADFEESIDKPEEILLFCHNKQQTSSLQTTYARPEEIIIDNMVYYLTRGLLIPSGNFTKSKWIKLILS
ncbi:hypothetical protein V8E54_002996 [Elaphomyces granulatus]